jgi:hypothetical protein
MDAFGIHIGNHQENLQLGSDNLKTIEHLCTIGLDAEGGGGTHFLHGLVPSRRHVHKERLRRHEYKMACCKPPSSCLLQHTLGE